MPANVSSEEFERLVAEALDEVPDSLAERISNLYVVVEPYPDPETSAEVTGGGTHLLGLYSGIPLTQRSEAYTGVLPDRITLYQRNIEALADSEDDIVDIVRTTVIHEIAHHFGISDERLEELGWA